MELLFDIGITTQNAVQNFLNGVPLENCGGSDIRSNGNGSLMRMLPIAFYVKDFEFIDRYNVVKKYSSLTHSHGISILCCFYYTEFLRLLINGYNVSEAYILMQESFLQKLIISQIDISQISVLYRLLNTDVSLIDIDGIKSTGYVVNTLEASLWSVLTSKTYKDSVLKAVNLGGDTDTIGAITGSIASLAYGISDIPSDWISQIPKFDIIQNLIVDFNSLCQN